MAQPPILIQSLLDSTKEAVYYHRGKVDQLKHRDYPFKCCSDLLQKLFAVDEAILNELSTIDQELYKTRDGDQENIFVAETIDKLQRYGQLLGVLHSLLVYFELGSRDFIQEGTSVPIEHMMKEFGDETAFIIVPIFDYNYMYWDILKPLKKSLKNALPSIDIDKMFSSMPNKYAVFGLPLSTKNNIVLNALLAHELGHYLDETKDLSLRILKKVELDEKKVDALIKIMEKTRLGEKEVALTYFITSGTLRAQLIRVAATQIFNWITELVSDDIAFHLFGPIFLHSLSSFLLTIVKLDEASSDHPSPRLRINLLLEEFETMKYPTTIADVKEQADKTDAENFVKFTTEIKNLLVNVKPEKSTDPQETVMFQKIIIDAVEKVVPEIRKEVHQLVAKLEYTPLSFKNNVFDLSKTLGVVVPPSEIEVGKSADCISILNAGALYKLLHASDLNELFKAESNIEKLEVRDKINALILKALELQSTQIRMQQILEGDKNE
jgi:hypothetical protein